MNEMNEKWLNQRANDNLFLHFTSFAVEIIFWIIILQQFRWLMVLWRKKTETNPIFPRHFLFLWERNVSHFDHIRLNVLQWKEKKLYAKWLRLQLYFLTFRLFFFRVLLFCEISEIAPKTFNSHNKHHLRIFLPFFLASQFEHC